MTLAGLWFFQQKLFMPPAQTPEQAMQYKLMGYMMPLQRPVHLSPARRVVPVQHRQRAAGP